MTNSADPDQLASQKPTDLDLHCLQRQGLSGFSRTRGKNCSQYDLNNVERDVKHQTIIYLQDPGLTLLLCWPLVEDLIMVTYVP